MLCYYLQLLQQNSQQGRWLWNFSSDQGLLSGGLEYIYLLQIIPASSLLNLYMSSEGYEMSVVYYNWRDTVPLPGKNE